MLAVDNPFEEWQPPTRQHMKRIVREESEAVLKDLAEQTRRAAKQHPSWERYADKLGVHADGGETYMGLPPGDEDEDAVFDLEHGTDRHAPAAVLRTTLSAHERRLGHQLGQRLFDRLAGS